MLVQLPIAGFQVNADRIKYVAPSQKETLNATRTALGPDYEVGQAPLLSL